MRNAIFACGLSLFAATTAAGAASADATLTVKHFYDWYLTQHGNVDWYAAQRGSVNWGLALHHHTAKYFQAQRLLHPDLFEALDDTYIKGVGDAEPVFYVSTTPERQDSKMSSFDPFVGAATPAISYHVEDSWSGQVSIGGSGPNHLRAVTFVPVSFTFADDRPATRITAVVRRNGNSYQIYDIHYGPIPFYYAGRIDDLLRFLSAYNC